MKDEPAAHTLARFVEGLSFGHLVHETREHAKLAILDAVGCGLAGAQDPVIDLLIASLAKGGEAGRTSLLGRRERFSPRTAALVNGALIHALELDDTHSFSSVHAGGPVVAATLSACATERVDGKRFIEAIVAGYELACRLGVAMRGKNPYHRGFHPTGICGVFGAATAWGKIAGLDREGYLNAWGIAGSMASGLMAYLQNGAWTKKIHPGWAAQSGLLAALLAREGYVGPNDIFEGQYGFCKAYSDHFDGAALLEALGERFEVDRMSFKRFACCRTIHGPMSAALQLRSLARFGPHEIEEIHVTIADEDLDLVVEPLEKKKHPQTPVEAQFSMPFGLALALVHGEAMPDQYTPEGIGDPLIVKLCGLFSYTVDDAFTRRRPLHFPCVLKIKARGEWFTAAVDAPLGDYTNPLSLQEMVLKFRSIAAPVVGARATQKIERFILFLDGKSGTKQLLSLIRPGLSGEERKAQDKRRPV